MMPILRLLVVCGGVWWGLSRWVQSVVERLLELERRLDKRAPEGDTDQLGAELAGILRPLRTVWALVPAYPRVDVPAARIAVMLARAELRAGRADAARALIVDARDHGFSCAAWPPVGRYRAGQELGLFELELGNHAAAAEAFAKAARILQEFAGAEEYVTVRDELAGLDTANIMDPKHRAELGAWAARHEDRRYHWGIVRELADHAALLYLRRLALLSRDDPAQERAARLDALARALQVDGDAAVEQPARLMFDELAQASVRLSPQQLDRVLGVAQRLLAGSVGALLERLLDGHRGAADAHPETRARLHALCARYGDGARSAENQLAAIEICDRELGPLDPRTRRIFRLDLLGGFEGYKRLPPHLAQLRHPAFLAEEIQRTFGWDLSRLSSIGYGNTPGTVAQLAEMLEAGRRHAELSLESGDSDDARAFAVRLAHIADVMHDRGSPEWTRAHLTLAQAYALERRGAEAAKELELVERTAAPEQRVTVARVWLSIGEQARARAELEAARALAASADPALKVAVALALADLAEAEGQRAAALAELDRACAELAQLDRSGAGLAHPPEAQAREALVPRARLRCHAALVAHRAGDAAARDAAVRETFALLKSELPGAFAPLGEAVRALASQLPETWLDLAAPEVGRVELLAWCDAPDADPVAAAWILGALAHLSLSSGDSETGVTLLQRARERAEKHLHDMHPLVVALLERLAAAYTALGREAEARSIYVALQTRSEDRHGDHSSITRMYANQANAWK